MTIATNDPTKEHFMKISSLGGFNISVTPTVNAEIMAVDIIAQNRSDTVSMTTNKDETADQFAMRIKSMMRAMLNAQPRPKESETILAPPTKTFEEQKAELQKKAK